MIRFALALTLTAAAGLSQGLHLPPPPHPGRPDIRPLPLPSLFIRELAIRARIDDGIATTSLRQVFHNPGAGIAEATWLLPLPAGATADDFTMTMNGRQVRGEVLDAGRARTLYEDIVRRRRDPGLLEYIGDGCLRARVFPVPARSDMVVEVRYRQVLPESGGIHGWSFPLRAANVHGRPARHLTLDLAIHSQKPIRNVYSPCPGVDIVRQGDHAARVTMELRGGRAASRDLEVFYGLSEREFGLNLLTHRRPGQPGFFAMLLAPKLQWHDDQQLPKSIQFVIDTSGSMSGAKIEQARKAVRFFVNSLRADDYFNVVPFATEARPFFAQPRRASRATVQEALAKIAGIEARGGTNIEQALTQSLGAATPDVPNIVAMTVFVTDGLPTVNTTDPESLLKLVRHNNRQRQRIFVFGVGHDVNTRLLDKLAAQSHGARDYVKEDESIEIKTGALFTKLSHPVMTGVHIDCAGIDGFEIFPRTTPDLFQGSRLLITGRYRGSGSHAIRLSGVVAGKQRSYVYEGTFPAHQPHHDFLPTLWAQRKVAVLLDAIRLNGRNQELIDAIRRLGAEYGIVTPYTSHLILEDGTRVGRAIGVRDPARTPGSEAERDRLRRELVRAGELDDRQAAAKVQTLGRDLLDSRRAGRADLDAFGEETGKAAVSRSRALRILAERKSVDGDAGAAGLVTHHVAGHTFHLIDGRWIDGAFEPAMKPGLRQVPAFSDEYFALLRRHPELRKVLAFSSRILIVVDGAAIEIR